MYEFIYFILITPLIKKKTVYAVVLYTVNYLKKNKKCTKKSCKKLIEDTNCIIIPKPVQQIF